MDERRQQWVEQPERREAHAQSVHDECAREVLPDDPPAAARDAHRLHELAQVAADEHEVGALHRHRGARAHRYAHGGLRQRGSVVHAVADHRHHLTVSLQYLDVLLLLMRHQLGAHLVHLKLVADSLRHQNRVAREQHRSQAELAQLPNGVPGFGTEHVA